MRYSSVEERHPYIVKVIGSIPITSTVCSNGEMVNALDLESRNWEIEMHSIHEHIKQWK